MLEMDLVKINAKLKKGIFLHIDHYTNSTLAYSIEPSPLSLTQKITTHPLFRFILANISIHFHRDVSATLHRLLKKPHRY
jgi:hypothetical protein